jgi:hypothetical protein
LKTKTKRYFSTATCLSTSALPRQVIDEYVRSSEEILLSLELINLIFFISVPGPGLNVASRCPYCKFVSYSLQLPLISREVERFGILPSDLMWKNMICHTSIAETSGKLESPQAY